MCGDGVAVDDQPPQFAVGVTEGIQPRDRLLAKVAAFGEAEAPLIAGDFLREVVFGDVDAIGGKAGVDAEGFPVG